jgi:hypothetical protein
MDFKSEFKELSSSSLGTKVGFFSVIFIFFIVSIFIGRCSKGEIVLPPRIDTVLVDKPCPELPVAKTEKFVKPIPSVTKYKIGDMVCVWGKWSGPVDDIVWSSTDESQTVLKYNVQTYNFETSEWVLENWYYESELEAGKCN